MKNASRDEAILRHLGLYRISIRSVLSRLFFAGRDPGNVLQRLRAAGLVQEWPKRRASDARARAGFLTGLSYYQLTVAGALGRVPLTRAAPLNTRALHKHFAVLWFCAMAGAARTRLEPSTLTRLFGGEMPPRVLAQVPHCLEEREGTRRIHRLYVPSPTANPRTVLRRLDADLTEARGTPGKLTDWIRTGTYALSVLVMQRASTRDQPDAASTLRAALRRRALPVGVYVVPGPMNVVEELHARQHA